jgi:hypothetical protein
MDAFDPRPRTQGTIGEKVIAGNDRVDLLNRRLKPQETPSTRRPTRVVRIPVENGVVEIENQSACGPSQYSKLPTGQEFPLQDHRIVTGCPVELEGPSQGIAFKAFAGQRPTRFPKRPVEGANPIPAADVVGRFDQGE